jgi:hypothetical protein
MGDPLAPSEGEGNREGVRKKRMIVESFGWERDFVRVSSQEVA